MNASNKVVLVDSQGTCFVPEDGSFMKWDGFEELGKEMVSVTAVMCEKYGLVHLLEKIRPSPNAEAQLNFLLRHMEGSSRFPSPRNRIELCSIAPFFG